METKKKVKKMKKNETKITVPKVDKQYSYKLSDEDFDKLLRLSERYRCCKNYIFSRFSGINSLIKLNTHRKDIRPLLTGVQEQFRLSYNYWNSVLDEVIPNIKSEWSNTKNRIKHLVNNNQNLSDEEKHYIYYILKDKKNEKLYYVLTYQEDKVELSKDLSKLELNTHRLNNLIRRYVRKCKGKVSYCKNCVSLSLTRDLYKYSTNKQGQFGIGISLLEEDAPKNAKFKRLFIPLKDNNIHKGNLQLILNKEEKTVAVHRVKQVETKPVNGTSVIGIDKGYTSLFAVSSDKEYGKDLGKLLLKESDRLDKVNAKRNAVWSLIDKAEKAGDFEKAERIRKNNFGRKKYDNKKHKKEEEIKSYINHSLKEMIETEKPKLIVCEDLTFVSWKKKLPKKVKRRLSNWCKGYIQERLEYKCRFYLIELKLVNASYTSQVCHICGRFGVRDGKVFKCKKHGTLDADINASHNILNRLYDKEIDVYTSYKKVKEILEKRIR